MRERGNHNSYCIYAKLPAAKIHTKKSVHLSVSLFLSDCLLVNSKNAVGFDGIGYRHFRSY